MTGLDRQHRASVHTIDSYRHASFRLLLAFTRDGRVDDPHSRSYPNS